MATRVLSDNTAAVLAKIEGRLATITAAAAFQIEADAKAAIQTGTKSGRTYKRGKRFHQASAAGEAPATDTSALVNSIHAAKVDAKGLRWRISATAEYAAALEFGTGTIAARPFLMPAYDRAKAAYTQAVRRLLRA